MEIIFLALPLTVPFRGKLVKDRVMPNDEDINDEIIIYYDYSLASSILSLQNKIMDIEIM